MLIPLVAMQFSSEVHWTRSDFVIAGVLIFGTGLVHLAGVALLGGRAQRIVFAIVLAVVFLLVWTELAVGLFGSPWVGS